MNLFDIGLTKTELCQLLDAEYPDFEKNLDATIEVIDLVHTGLTPIVKDVLGKVIVPPQPFPLTKTKGEKYENTLKK